MGTTGGRWGIQRIVCESVCVLVNVMCVLVNVMSKVCMCVFEG